MTHPSNTVSVIGADGMLGRAVVRALEDSAKDFNIHEITSVHGESDGRPFVGIAPYVINCAGIVRGRTEVDPIRSIRVNAAMPHFLAGDPNLKRMVTVSTDCVFNGLDGPYSEDSQPTPTDLYSRSKLVGEVLDSDKVLTVRTSFIGFGQHGFLRWLLTQPRATCVPGYDDRIWNGFYVGNIAKSLVYLCLRTRISGLLHFSGNTMSKYELIRLIIDRLRPDMLVSWHEVGKLNHVLLSNRHDEFDVGVVFGASMTQLFKDYEEWGKDYLND